MTARVTLGGVVVGGSDAYEWELVVGTLPAEHLFTLSAERAERIPLGRPIIYEKTGVRKPLKVENLYALEVLPAGNPRQRRVRVVDRRWLWERKVVAADFNVPITRGQLFLIQSSSTLENAIIEEQQQFAKYSLFPVDNGTKRWTARQALDYVFSKLECPYRIEDQPFPIQEIEVQDLALDDDGGTALERVLRYLPGSDVYIDKGGTAVVFNSQPPDPGGTRERGAPPFPYLARKHASFPGDVQIVNRRAIKPSAVYVYFTPEVEVRFNFNEGGTLTTDSNELRNIGFLPDFTLSVNGRTLPRGSPLALDSMFSAWGAFATDPETNASMEITVAKLRKYALKHGWASFEQMFGNQPLLVPNAVYQQRAAEAVRRWRRTYQVAEGFMDRITSLKAVRVAVVNPVTGRRAPSEAYCDWVRRPAMKGFANPEDINRLHGWAVRGYADLLADAKAAPADVTVLDPRAGIIDVAPRVDPFGLSQAMVLGYPSTVGGATLPTQIGMSDANRTGQDLYAQWDLVELDATFKLAVVLTVVPASPNDLRRFHRVTVRPGDVGEASAEGPEWHVRVYPGLLTARFAWTDSQGQALIDAIKGTADSYPATALVNQDLVTAVAQATARRIYSRYRDGPSGQAAIDMDPNIEPSGWLSSVRHTLTGGVTETVVHFGGPRRPIEIWPFLSAAHRKILTRDLEV